jgi:hypothetical protein
MRGLSASNAALHRPSRGDQHFLDPYPQCPAEATDAAHRLSALRMCHCSCIRGRGVCLRFCCNQFTPVQQTTYDSALLHQREPAHMRMLDYPRACLRDWQRVCSLWDALSLWARSDRAAARSARTSGLSGVQSTNHT